MILRTNSGRILYCALDSMLFEVGKDFKQIKNVRMYSAALCGFVRGEDVLFGADSKEILVYDKELVLT